MKNRETPKTQPTVSFVKEQLHASLDDVHRQDIAELIVELQQLEDTLDGDSDRWEQELYTVNRQCEYLRAGDSIARRRMALRTIHDLETDILDMQSYRDEEKVRRQASSQPVSDKEVRDVYRETRARGANIMNHMSHRAGRAHKSGAKVRKVF